MENRPRRARESSLSVVVPVFNEEGNLRSLHERLTSVVQPLVGDYEIIFVNDGSADHSMQLMGELAAVDPHVRFLGFTRNFGHESATSAGLDYASGDAVVIIDADLQDPPGVIAEMVQRWEEGYDIVYGRRTQRKEEPALKRLSSHVFYRVMRRIAEVEIPLDTGDFRIMDRRMVEYFRLLRERNRFVRAEIAWLGGNTTEVLYERDRRLEGKTTYNFTKRLKLSMDGIASFSAMPLHIMSVLGFAVFFLSLVAILVVFIQKIFFGIPVPGYAFLVISLFFLNGVEIFFIGMLGEYVARIYREVQDRPLYLISSMGGFEVEEDGEGSLPGDV
jgi:dolichol-phosphate mannosyltransferase